GRRRATGRRRLRPTCRRLAVRARAVHGLRGPGPRLDGTVAHGVAVGLPAGPARGRRAARAVERHREPRGRHRVRRRLRAVPGAVLPRHRRARRVAEVARGPGDPGQARRLRERGVVLAPGGRDARLPRGPASRPGLGRGAGWSARRPYDAQVPGRVDAPGLPASADGPGPLGPGPCPPRRDRAAEPARGDAHRARGPRRDRRRARLTAAAGLRSTMVTPPRRPSRPPAPGALRRANPTRRTTVSDTTSSSSNGSSSTEHVIGTAKVKRGMAEMLKGGVIMDVVTPDQAQIAEDAGAVAVMALERVPADIRAQGGVARMSDPDL